MSGPPLWLPEPTRYLGLGISRSHSCRAGQRQDRPASWLVTFWVLMELSVGWLEYKSAAEAREREPGLVLKMAPVLSLQYDTRDPWEAALQRPWDGCREEALGGLGRPQ
jgi:hypothetical protein